MSASPNELKSTLYFLQNCREAIGRWMIFRRPLQKWLTVCHHVFEEHDQSQR